MDESAFAPWRGLLRQAVVFLPGEVPRQGRIAFWSPTAEALPEVLPARATRTVLTVARAVGAGARTRTVPAVEVPLEPALAPLLRAAVEPGAHPAARCWAAAARLALQLTARGALLPGLTGRDQDAWRAGPLSADDLAQLRAVAAAMPAEAHATPLPESRPLSLPDPEALLRAFLDAVADTLPRTPAARYAAGAPFAASAPQTVPGIRDWAVQVAAGADAGVGVSLRLDLSGYALFDPAADPAVVEGGTGTGPDATAAGAPLHLAGAALVQVHSLADPTRVTDASALWAGLAAPDSFGPRARVDAVLALRRAARTWPPLARLLDRPVPDVLALSDAELEDLLGTAGARLAAAGVPVHWPRSLARTLTATAVVRPAPGSAADGTSFFDADRLFAFSWEIALGADRLTPGELDALAEAHRPVIRLRDQWVRVDPDLVRKARKRHLGLLDPVDALSVALTGTAEVDGETVPAVPVGALAALRTRLTSELAPLPTPPGLHATLRAYQQRGLAWLDLMTSLGLGGCLADDMGLGKTVTLIALHLHRAQD
ncbi:SNF2 helicase-associated domain-containing protein, partial [Streptomyces sp. NPDC097619]|uniref:SNF2 helicase-associated domain-containing protein n=1 Tax=Streptomyces sp. NPDC097619 TaxID=3157228 RepID=UPI00332FD681